MENANAILPPVIGWSKIEVDPYLTCEEEEAEEIDK